MQRFAITARYGGEGGVDKNKKIKKTENHSVQTRQRCTPIYGVRNESSESGVLVGNRTTGKLLRKRVSSTTTAHWEFPTRNGTTDPYTFRLSQRNVVQLNITFEYKFLRGSVRRVA